MTTETTMPDTLEAAGPGRSWKFNRLRGKQVEVTVDRPADGNGPVLVRGMLLGYSDGGNAAVVADDKGDAECLPLLDIREAAAPGQATRT